MSLSPEQRSLRASIAAHHQWAQTPDKSARTQSARDAFRKSFEKKVDPDGVLDPEERARRADHLYQAHFKRMALARSRKAGNAS